MLRYLMFAILLGTAAAAPPPPAPINDAGVRWIPALSAEDDPRVAEDISTRGSVAAVLRGRLLRGVGFGSIGSPCTQDSTPQGKVHSSGARRLHGMGTGGTRFSTVVAASNGYLWDGAVVDGKNVDPQVAKNLNSIHPDWNLLGSGHRQLQGGSVGGGGTGRAHGYLWGDSAAVVGDGNVESRAVQDVYMHMPRG